MTKLKRKRAKDDPEQSRLFIEKAREIEADENKSVADKLMGKLAEKKPEHHRPKNK